MPHQKGNFWPFIAMFPLESRKLSYKCKKIYKVLDKSVFYCFEIYVYAFRLYLLIF